MNDDTNGYRTPAESQAALERAREFFGPSVKSVSIKRGAAANHTPAPWAWDKSRGVVYICLRSGRRIAQMIVGDMPANEEDATHIVCCVNAWDDAAALRARLAELETTIYAGIA